MSEGNCVGCDCLTKYLCIRCDKFACNRSLECSIPAPSEYPGWCEFKKVALCLQCDMEDRSTDEGTKIIKAETIHLEMKIKDKIEEITIENDKQEGDEELNSDNSKLPELITDNDSDLLETESSKREQNNEGSKEDDRNEGNNEDHPEKTTKKNCDSGNEAIGNNIKKQDENTFFSTGN